MPTRDTAPLGAPCWIDLFTSDPDRAADFYGRVFGWTAESAGDEYGGYITYSKDGNAVAGGMKNECTTGEVPDRWTIYLATADIEATAEAVTANGGRIEMGPMEVPELGHMAVGADPGDAAVAMWQPTGFQGFGVLGEHGTPGWFELHTRNYDTIVGFYEKVFGWDTHVAGDSPEFRYTTLGEGENQLAGIMDASAFAADAPLGWSVYFAVDDADATVATIVSAGGSITHPAEDTPYGRLAAATDPTGAAFKLVAG